MRGQPIAIHPQAPDKPAVGQACNGCGVCCLLEPCPIGKMVSWRWRGACRLLVWQPGAQHYRCGLLAGRGQHGGAERRPRWLQRLAQRWIAAGRGCDAHLSVTRPSSRSR